MRATWKIHKCPTFKKGSSQNERFLKGPGGRKLSSQNGSLPFKTGELEHMVLLCHNSDSSILVCEDSLT